jgi:uncharacterized repeat protein (TIGR03803 family)
MKFGVMRRVASVLCFGLFAIGPAATPVFADNALTSVFRFYQSTTEGDVIFGDAGYLFGTTNSYSVGHGGTIFKVKPDGTDLQTIYQLGAVDGISPNTGLLKASDGNYYGTTQFSSRGVAFSATGNGTIYQLKTNSGAPTYTTLHTFDPTSPKLEGSFVLVAGGGYVRGSNLIEANQSVYGITPYGGANGTGTIYSFPLSSPGTPPTFYSFKALDSSSKNDGGSQPLGALIQGIDGNFYGTTVSGGANGTGAVFKFDGAGTFTSVLDFAALDSTGHTDCGTAPEGGVVEVNGFLYGTTSAGGANGDGTVFKVPLDGNVHTCGAAGDGSVVFASFDGTNGFSPGAELIKDQTDTRYLYGTSVGASGLAVTYGNIFQVDVSPDTPVITNVVNLDSTHGAAPRTRLLQSVSNGISTFYGTTSAGGGDYCTAGTVYRYGPSGSTDAGSPCPGTGGGSMTPALLLLLSTLGVARRFGSRRLEIEEG